MPTVSEALTLALQHHQAGNLPQAEQLYKQILQADPNHADAHHLLGVLAFQAGRHDQALVAFRRAVGLNPTAAIYCQNLAIAQEALGQLEDAMASYWQCTRLQPESVDAYLNLGNVLFKLRRLEDAVASYRQALRVNSNNAGAYNNMGNALRELGRFDEAVASYGEALRLQPDMVQAHNNLGTTLKDLGRLDEAVDRLNLAIRLNPNYAEAHNNLGNTLTQMGRNEQAVECFQRSLQINPNYAEAYNNLGIALKNLGRLEEAEAQYRRALALIPHVAEVHSNLGTILERRDKFPEAIACYEHAIKLKPTYADAWYNLAHLHQIQENLDEALRCYREVLRLRPNHLEGLNNLGDVLCRQEKYEAALWCYHEALRYRPDYADAHNNMGNVYFTQQKFEEAVPWFQNAIRFRPTYGEAYNNLATSYCRLRRFDEAQVSCQEALRINPANAEAHNNMGGILERQGKLDEAMAEYREAIRLKPTYAEAYSNLGIIWWNQNKHAEAVECYQESIRLKPKFADAHLNLSLAWLLSGDFERGWPAYEWRLKSSEATPRPFTQPRWDGSAFSGRTILVWGEQGLGDMIQFIRYLPLVKERGGNVVVECQPPLLHLLKGFPGIDSLVAQASPSAPPAPLPNFDVQTPLLSLPGIFHTNLGTIPAGVPYLKADEQQIAQWRRELGPPKRDGGQHLRVGIAWQGNPNFRGDRLRSFPLTRFSPLARIEGVKLVSLQVGPGVEQMASLGGQFPVLDLAERLGNPSQSIMNIAAAMSSLDLVISCDSAVAHLAGRWALPCGSPCRWCPIGVGCEIARTVRGIRHYGCSGKPSIHIGMMFSNGWRGRCASWCDLPMNDNDKAGRYLVKRSPEGFFRWFFGNPFVEFEVWMDARRVALPNQRDLTNDLVAALTIGGKREAMRLELEAEARADALTRVFGYVARLWTEPGGTDSLPVSCVSGAILDLTGRSSARALKLQSGVSPDCRLELGVVRRSLTDEDAGRFLAAIAKGEISPWQLGWIPLMKSGCQRDIIVQWKQQAEKLMPDDRQRADLTVVALTFASLARCRAVWQSALGNWNMQTSPFLDEIRAEARKQAREEGRAEALRAMLFRQGRQKFGKAPTKKQQKELDSVSDSALLETLGERLVMVDSWADLLNGG